MEIYTISVGALPGSGEKFVSGGKNHVKVGLTPLSLLAPSLSSPDTKAAVGRTPRALFLFPLYIHLRTRPHNTRPSLFLTHNPPLFWPQFWDVPSTASAGGELSSKSGIYGKSVKVGLIYT